MVETRRIHLVVLGGSRAFGTAFPDCDYDYYGVFGRSLRTVLSANPPSKDSYQWVIGDDDYTFHEMGKFLRLALKGNSTVLETLFSPIVVYEDRAGHLLRSIRHQFLSRRVLYAYLGYAKDQARRYHEGKSLHSRHGDLDAKFLTHALRLLYGGIKLMTTGQFVVQLDAPTVNDILALRDMSYKDGAVKLIEEQTAILERMVTEGLTKAEKRECPKVLPEEPNIEAANSFLYAYRLGRLE
jgi:predicted nucleotidyltransferase